MKNDLDQSEPASSPAPHPNPRSVSLADAVDYYLAHHASSWERKLGGRTVREAPIGAIKLHRLTTKAIQTWLSGRLDRVTAGTAKNDLTVIRRAIEIARRDLDVPLRFNPALGVEVDDRDRRLSPEELEGLYTALEDNPLVQALVIVAVETGLSRGVLLELQWRDVDVDQAVVYVRDGPGGPRAMIVHLSDSAVATLMALGRRQTRVFPIQVDRLRWDWEAATRRAGVKGVKFHERRHVLKREGGSG